MNILLATEVIVPGGAEAFVLRLSKAYQDRGHSVVVFGFYEDQGDSNIARIIAPGVEVVWAKYPFPALLQKIDGLLFRLKIDSSVRNYFVRRSLKKLIRRQHTEVMHSHLLKVDAMCVQVGKELNVPVVTTIHGDYLQFYNKTKNNIPIPLLHYKRKAAKNLTALKKVVCISDKQLAFFNDIFSRETNTKLIKIYNGYQSAKPTGNGMATRQNLGIKDTDFVFGMVSRGIAEKGWQTAIDAFLRLAQDNTHLVLVGDGEHLTKLKNDYRDNNSIHFTGNSGSPLELINTFDVALLPSVYASESLPTVVIEYLFCGKPVIASDAGEISNMLQNEGRQAGIIIPIKDGAVSSQELYAAMERYMSDTVLYHEHSSNAATCFEQFDMDKCIGSYMDVYKNAINAKELS
ncbi:MAG: glycosyltransferase family 4 protein [Bacteroidetes bacterium]|nr:glycosyltransferase family 4 protein [Bacteroidota bacterium]